MILTSSVFDQSQLALLFEHDPVVQEYRSFSRFLIGLSLIPGTLAVPLVVVLLNLKALT